MTTWLVVVVAVAALVMAWRLFRAIVAQPAGEPRAIAVALQIERGAMLFLRREYALLLLFVALVAPALWLALGWGTALAFGAGALSSALAGFIGMKAATRANLRTAAAAHHQGLGAALEVAFSGGAVMGLVVAALGLLGLGALYLAFGGDPATAAAIHGFGMGASSVALLARVGGGIYTKSADVGADLVGKIEAGIPEDDRRNPGVIADNVGDNVGDVAGMGSDIFESYCGAIIATLAMAAAMEATHADRLGAREALMALPLLLAAAGLLCSMAAIAAVRALACHPPALVLRLGMVGAAALFVGAAWLVIWASGVAAPVWGAVVAGALGGVAIGLTTEYYTRGRPVRRVAEAGRTGAATVIITGLATGMRATWMPVAAVCAVILSASALCGLYGVGIAAVGMLATVGMIMAVDAYGPVADNAGGIAEMAGLGSETRAVTDRLDELGNTTAAIGKGFAIGAAALAALAIISAYMETVARALPGFSLDLSEPLVLSGLFIGALFPYLVAATTMTAVGEAAMAMIDEIRRQFREIPGLLEGRAEPDSARCVDIATRAALSRMVVPAVLAVSAPVAVGFTLGPAALGGMLGGALVSGVLLAITLANAGGVWDNAKKWVERGALGGKGSEVHQACVVGDTVGDPFKDTSGPALNILIKVLAFVSLVIAPLLV